MAKPESIASYWQVTFHAPQAQAQSAADALDEAVTPKVLSISLFEQNRVSKLLGEILRTEMHQEAQYEASWSNTGQLSRIY